MYEGRTLSSSFSLVTYSGAHYSGLVTIFPPLSYRIFPAAQNSPERSPIIFLHGFAATGEQLWVRTGWVKRFTAEGYPCIIVDLPYHRNEDLKNPDPSLTYTGDIPLPEEHGFFVSAAHAVAQFIEDLDSPAHLVGFSAGARIAWEASSYAGHNVLSTSIGGLPQHDHLPLIAQYLLGSLEQENINPTFPAVINHSLIRESSLKHFACLPLAFDFDPTLLHPLCPILLVRGSEDSVAGDYSWLTEALTEAHVPYEQLILDGRNHVNALTSGVFKKRVLALVQESEEAFII